MKMNKKQFIFSPVRSHMSGSSKGRLLGKESGAGSHKSHQGGHGKTLSDRGTIPQHPNKKAEQVHDSRQGQQTRQWPSDEAVITSHIWGHTRQVSQQGRVWSDEGKPESPTNQWLPGKSVAMRQVQFQLHHVVPQPRQRNSRHDMILHFKRPFHWIFPCLIIPFLQVSMSFFLWNGANRTEITVTANCFTDLTVFGITGVTRVYLFVELPFSTTPSQKITHWKKCAQFTHWELPWGTFPLCPQQ